MINAYAYKNENQIRRRSSSGGAFMALAEAFFTHNPGGVVFGVTINGTSVFYDEARSLKECEKFQESKYIRASIKDVYSRVGAYLQVSIPVLVAGLPCQMEGLRKYLESKGIEDRQVYVIDLICHGTGRDDVWKQYTNWLETKYGSKICDYSFRSKKISWGGYPVYVKFANGKELVDTYEARVFIRLFLKKMIMNTSCYNCKFKNMNRSSDVTLGDFWGIKKIKPEMYDRNGVSLLLTNNEKGEQLVRILSGKSEAELIKIEKDQLTANQENLVRNYIPPKERNSFLQDLAIAPFDRIIRKYGIYTTKGRIRALIIALLDHLRLRNAIKRIIKRDGY